MSVKFVSWKSQVDSAKRIKELPMLNKDQD